MRPAAALSAELMGLRSHHDPELKKQVTSMNFANCSLLSGLYPQARGRWRAGDHLFLSPVSSLLSPEVVEVNGIEPMTSCVQGRRSPS